MPSYAVAFAYVAGDTADKANQAASRGYSSPVVAWAAADVFLWQSLASVAIPGTRRLIDDAMCGVYTK